MNNVDQRNEEEQIQLYPMIPIGLTPSDLPKNGCMVVKNEVGQQVSVWQAVASPGVF